MGYSVGKLRNTLPSNDMEENTTDTSAPVAGQQENTTTLRGGKRPTKILPSPRLAIQKQLEVLRAFAVASLTADGAPISNEQAGEIMASKMKASTVIVTNPFFCEVQFLNRKSGSFEVSDIAKAYQQAYEWNPETAGVKLAPALSDRWFSKILLPRLKMRDYTKREATQVLAEECEASKDYEENVAMLLEFMAVAGLIRLEGDLVKPNGSPGAFIASMQGGGAPKDTPPLQQQPPPEQPKGDICYLDPKRERKVIVYAPLDISPEEIDRLKNWLDLIYFVPNPKKASQESGSPT